MPNTFILSQSDTYIKWCVVRLDLRMNTQQHMHSKEIGVRARIVLTTLDSIVNTTKGPRYLNKGLAHKYFQ
jgi:hypothetical protein